MGDRAKYYGLWMLGGVVVSLVTGSWWPLVAVLFCCLGLEMVLHEL